MPLLLAVDIMTSSIEPGQHQPLPRRILLGALRGYQLVLSPLTGTRCRFYPCCSNYAIEAVQQHGCWRGSWFTFRRILRCNPCFAGGYDPVPQAASPARK